MGQEQLGISRYVTTELQLKTQCLTTSLTLKYLTLKKVVFLLLNVGWLGQHSEKFSAVIQLGRLERTED